MWSYLRSDFLFTADFQPGVRGHAVEVCHRVLVTFMNTEGKTLRDLWSALGVSLQNMEKNVFKVTLKFRKHICYVSDS